MKRITDYANFVKFEHTLFSLPVILSGVFMAAGGLPDARILFLVLAAGTGARTVALGLNRIIDRNIDIKNPRTWSRELPSGTVSLKEAGVIITAGLLLYFLAAYLICDLVLVLSPLPLLVFVIYPYMKRYTQFCHFGVGLALSLAPLGGWLAVKCSFEGLAAPLMISGFTLFWVAGFDIIYATLDEHFDRSEGIYSLVSVYGRKTALYFSALSHLTAFIFLVVLYLVYFSSLITLVVLLLVGILLFLEYKKSSDVDLAFFRINIIIGFSVFIFILCGIYFH